MLKGYVDSRSKGTDSLSAEILDFYGQMTEITRIINEYSKNDVLDNVKQWKENYPWFYLQDADRLKDEAFLSYLLNDADFKNRGAMRKALLIGNLKATLEVYNKNAAL